MGIETFIVLDWQDKFAGKIMKVLRKDFWRYSLHAISKQHLIEIIEHYDLLENPYFENHYHMLNVYIDNCKENIARRLLHHIEIKNGL